jgi:hypothetical protein
MAIGTAQIAQARQAAAATRRRVVDVLEEAAGGDPDGFTARLAASLQLERLAMADLRAAAPAFDVVPYNQGRARVHVPGDGALRRRRPALRSRAAAWA